jgi:ribosomal protein L37AE/L43A
MPVTYVVANDDGPAELITVKETVAKRRKLEVIESVDETGRSRYRCPKCGQLSLQFELEMVWD